MPPLSIHLVMEYPHLDNTLINAISLFASLNFFFFIKEVVSQPLAKLNSLPTHETPQKPYDPIVWWIEPRTSEFMSCSRPMTLPLGYPRGVLIA
jgi:hypothetical protein